LPPPIRQDRQGTAVTMSFRCRQLDGADG
jgi:hypothetical protein